MGLDPLEVSAFAFVNTSGLPAGFLDPVPLGVAYNLSGSAGRDCIRLVTDNAWDDVPCSDAVDFALVCELEPLCGWGTYNSTDPVQPCAGCDYYCLAGEMMKGCAGNSPGVCVPTVDGTYKPLPGPTNYTICDFHCDAGSEKTSCGPISRGVCEPCAEGKFKPSAGTELCTACDSSCEAGTQSEGCAGPDEGVCAACRAGTFKSSNGTCQCQACSPCDAGQEMVGCGGVEAGACAACKPGTFKTASGTTVCASCGALMCEAGKEIVGCGLVSSGSCEACPTGKYKPSNGTQDCGSCVDRSSHAILDGAVVSGELELPSASSLGSGYVLHEDRYNNGLYTVWEVEDSLVPNVAVLSRDGDFSVHSRVQLDHLGASEISFVFWRGTLRYEVCFDCNHEIVAQWNSPSQQKRVSRYGAYEENTWHDIELRRRSQKLYLDVDGVTVYHDPNVRFDFPVSAIGWRAWRGTIRINSLSVTYNGNWCDAGFVSVGCQGVSAGECIACPPGTYKATGSTSGCSDCACDEGFEAVGCGGGSAGRCMACEQGKFKNQSGAGACEECHNCTAGQMRIGCSGSYAGLCVSDDWVDECAEGTDDCDVSYVRP
eukprot:3259353-Rhodomonas_salina.1